MRLTKIVALAAFALVSAAASAQTVKIGFITSYSGLNGNLGPYMERAVRLYIKQHQKELPPGVKIELIIRDDTGPNPDKARQLAQELVVRDKVDLLAGVIFTPNAMSMAPIATEAKVPFVIMNAGTSVITTRSPYIARVSFTLWQSSYPLGQWAAKKYKTAYTLVSDFGPGHDAETAFMQAFKEGGGNIVASVRVPLQNPDWAAYLQRVKDAKPDTLFVFIPAGKTATAVMKNFSELGLGQAGIKLIGPGDITTDEELPNMGDVALGVTTMFHYSAAGDRPANKAFVAAWKKEYGANETPNFLSAASWDGTAMIFEAIRQQKGKIDPDKTMAIFKSWKFANSPRGPISIDPETRDIVQNEYLREVRKVGGQLANVELETFAAAVKDPWKEQQKKK
ncbi:MAG: branched-chain amino acid ABC transporter substrate-binding protein [Rhodospirillales bacterium RIFCSPLOWO2_12_FULL_67_15]|nr:MAG: branched-chain amino acid ABC transporter substrate-binding protein [Rhodospirillales bacterium RIFCSPLOWO2_12_FULL_67_15]